VPAYVDQGRIIFPITCKFNNGTTSTTTYTIDRYTRTFTMAEQRNSLVLSGSCVAGQKQLF
jgi:hypothetical protein